MSNRRQSLALKFSSVAATEYAWITSVQRFGERAITVVISTEHMPASKHHLPTRPWNGGFRDDLFEMSVPVVAYKRPGCAQVLITHCRFLRTEHSTQNGVQPLMNCAQF